MAGPAGGRGVAGDLGYRRQRPGFERHHRGSVARGPGAARRHRPPRRRCRRGAGRRGPAHRCRIPGAVPRPRHHGAAELHRPCRRRPGRGLGADAGRRDRAGDGGGCRRPAAQQGRGSPHDARRRLRPARRDPGFRAASGADRQGGRLPGEARLEPGGGYRSGVLPADGAGAAERRASTPAGCRPPGTFGSPDTRSSPRSFRK